MRLEPRDMSESANRVLTFDVGAVAKLMEEKFPATWRRMQMRSIKAPGNYYSNRAIQVALCGAIEESKVAMDTNVGIIAGVLEKYDFPTYYVSEPLAEALKRSHPPQGLMWRDLPLPFQAMCFMLPKNFLLEERSNQECAFIGFAKLSAKEKLTIPFVANEVKISEDRISVFWAIGPSCVIVQDCTFPTTHPLEPLSEWIDERTSSMMNTKGRKYVGPSGKFSSYAAGLVANFLLVMEARKELVEPGKRIATAKVGKSGVYSPTFIGRNYTILKKGLEKSDSKFHFTELGWRAGHFKRQHFGVKKEQTKTIFVDPYIAFTRGLVANEEAVEK